MRGVFRLKMAEVEKVLEPRLGYVEEHGSVKRKPVTRRR
jgi:hypothetical protein